MKYNILKNEERKSITLVFNELHYMIIQQNIYMKNM